MSMINHCGKLIKQKNNNIGQQNNKVTARDKVCTDPFIDSSLISKSLKAHHL